MVNLILTILGIIFVALIVFVAGCVIGGAFVARRIAIAINKIPANGIEEEFAMRKLKKALVDWI